MSKAELRSIPDALTCARCLAGMTREELAKKAGVCIATICNIEREERPVLFKTAYQIAKVLDMQNVFDGFRIGKGVE